MEDAQREWVEKPDYNKLRNETEMKLKLICLELNIN